MPLRLYNTLTRRVEDFTPADPALVTFYSCGPTVYDDAHIGNFRSFLAADVLRRWIESPLCELTNDQRSAAQRATGRRVVHVMNITDVGHMTDDEAADGGGEDKMAVAGRRIAEAKKSGQLPSGVNVDPGDPYQVARFYEERFKDDARRLGLGVALDAQRDASLMPRATDSVPGMITLIQRLVASGHAYVVGTPEAGRVVYFDVQRFAAYGRLSGNTLANLRAGEGGRVSEANQSTKRHPADFLLWKEDPRHIMKWESPWGWGYPGWHIECSVMSAARLARAGAGPAGELASRTAALPPDELARLTLAGAQPLIDLHSGGEDNIFPHHECEIAQTCCAFNATPDGAPYARHWFHPRFLMVNGQKMSKSKGNFYTPRDLMAKGIDPAAIRLELIRTHYRSNADFSLKGLEDCSRMIERWRRFAASAGPGSAATSNAGTPDRIAASIEAEFAAAMHEDLNLAGAIGALNAWVGATDRPSADDARAIARLDRVLGVLERTQPAAVQTALGVFAPGVQPDESVESLLAARRDAKAAKDFARADAIRGEIAALGYAIKDLPGGKVEVRRA